MSPARSAWWAARDELLAIEPSGSRPWGCYAVELGEHPSGRVGETGWLAERGLLSSDEEAELLAWEPLSRPPNGVSPYAAAATIIRARRGIPEPAGVEHVTLPD